MATKKPKGLGRGLEALLGPAEQERAVGDVLGDAGAIVGLPAWLRLEDLVPGAYQPRTRMDEGALYELAESIKAQGIMQPILVRRRATTSPPAPQSQAEQLLRLVARPARTARIRNSSPASDASGRAAGRAGQCAGAGARRPATSRRRHGADREHGSART